MYPIKFEKKLVEKVWGGRSFESKLGFDLPSNKKYGESWEVSSHKNGMGIIKNGKFQGKTFQEIINKFGEELLGEKTYMKHGEKFPLLIKYLDINDKLSVQVHPDDKYALKNEGEPGKTEAWYVIDASSNAELIYGLKEEIDSETFSKKVKENDFKGLFNTINVKKGDFLFIKTGRVHASLKGSVLICEVQQNSDSTYRIYDFDRLVNGQKRDLHLDKALEVINFSADNSIERDFKINKMDGIEITRLCDSKYFNIEKVDINGEYKDGLDTEFRIYSILSGKGQIKYKDGAVSIKTGETVFIPANLDVKIIGEDLEILKTKG